MSTNPTPDRHVVAADSAACHAALDPPPPEPVTLEVPDGVRAEHSDDVVRMD